jgi:predicted 2-oxoglutarate/Fe(II)-dependent dioxygenase YbiX
MMMRKAVAAGGAASVSVAALVLKQYQEWQETQELSQCSEAHLPLSSEACATRVVHIPHFLSAKEVQCVHEVADRLKPVVGSAGRTSSNQAAAYQKGTWETLYLSTDGQFAREMPWLHERIFSKATEVDKQEGWNLLDRATTPIATRCVEYHTVEPGGSLPFPTHYDAGSLLTIDVLLTDPNEFEGGEFATLEPDGHLKPHHFRAGDALIFQSHKFHCVSPVTAGRRNVLIMEIWEGEERHCAHRCEKHRGHCGHTARMSFWRRALSDIGSDI